MIHRSLQDLSFFSQEERQIRRKSKKKREETERMNNRCGGKMMKPSQPLPASSLVGASLAFYMSTNWKKGLIPACEPMTNLRRL